MFKCCDVRAQELSVEEVPGRLEGGIESSPQEGPLPSLGGRRRGWEYMQGGL